MARLLWWNELFHGYKLRDQSDIVKLTFHSCFLSKRTGGKVICDSSEVSGCFALNLHSSRRIFLMTIRFCGWRLWWFHLGSLVPDFSHRLLSREWGFHCRLVCFPRVCRLWFALATCSVEVGNCLTFWLCYPRHFLRAKTVIPSSSSSSVYILSLIHIWRCRRRG